MNGRVPLATGTDKKYSEQAIEMKMNYLLILLVTWFYQLKCTHIVCVWLDRGDEGGGGCDDKSFSCY